MGGFLSTPKKEPLVPRQLNEADDAGQPLLKNSSKEFCFTCREILDSSEISRLWYGPDSRRIPILPTRTDFFEDSAPQGCLLCSLFFNSLRPDEKILLEERRSTYSTDPDDVGKIKTKYAIDLHTLADSVAAEHLILTAFHELNDGTDSFICSKLVLLQPIGGLTTSNMFPASSNKHVDSLILADKILNYGEHE